jgi:predicted negative regulator of RcsB-dependent stress response
LSIIQAILDDVDNLPKGFKKKLLQRLTDNNNDDSSDVLAEVITGNYDRLPEKVRNELLLKLADNQDAVGAIAWAAANDFDKLPDNIRNLSLKLANDKALSWTLAKGILVNYSKLPENIRMLLFRLADHDYAAATLAREMKRNFNRLPEKVRNELLLKLADNEYAREEVNALIEQSFYKLEPNIREELLSKGYLNAASKMLKESSTTSTKRLPNKVCIVCGEKRVPSEKRYGGVWGYRGTLKCDNCIFLENRLFDSIRIRKRKLPKKVEEAETVLMIVDQTTKELVGKFDNAEELRRKLDLYRAENPHSKIWVISMKYQDFTDMFIPGKSPSVPATLLEEITPLSK